MHTIDMLVGRSPFAMCTTCVGNCTCRLSFNAATLCHDAARVYNDIPLCRSKGIERSHRETSTSFLGIAIARYMGDECETGERTNSNTRYS